MNINLTANSPGERIILAFRVIGLLLDLADISWVTESAAEPMTHERALEICSPYPIKRLGSWEVECAFADGDGAER